VHIVLSLDPGVTGVTWSRAGRSCVSRADDLGQRRNLPLPEGWGG